MQHSLNILIVSYCTTLFLVIQPISYWGLLRYSLICMQLSGSPSSLLMGRQNWKIFGIFGI